MGMTRVREDRFDVHSGDKGSHGMLRGSVAEDNWLTVFELIGLCAGDENRHLYGWNTLETKAAMACYDVALLRITGRRY